MRKSLSSHIIFILITILISTLYLGNFTYFQKLQWGIDTLLYSIKSEDKASSNIVLVNIDDSSLRALGDWPWPYDRIADLIATCNSAGPKAILVNLDLSPRLSEDSSGRTQILANQVSWVDNVVLTYDITLAEYPQQRMLKPEYLFKSSIQSDANLIVNDEKHTLSIRKPFLPSGIISRYADGLGFIYTDFDNDHKSRWTSLTANYEGFNYPSAPLLTAAFFLGYGPNDITVRNDHSIAMGRYDIPADKAGRLFINYSKTSFANHAYSAAEILQEKIDISSLKNKLVIIGLSAAGTEDYVATPVSPKMSRTELYANIIENIVDNNYMKEANFSVGLNLLILIGLGALCAVVLPRISLLYRMIALVICLFILANLSYVLFSSYHMLLRPLYLGLELILFVAISPLLEESHISRSLGLNGKLLTAATAGSSSRPNTTRRKREALDKPVHIRDFDEEEIEEEVIQEESDMEQTRLLDSTPKSDPEMVQTIQNYSGHESTLPVETPKEPPVPPTPIPVQQADQSPAPLSPPSIDINRFAEQTPASGKVTLNDSDKVTHLGRYQVKEVLGKGAMGTVFKGVDPAINRLVALKTIRLDFVSEQNEMVELRDRLFREAQAAGKLSHPNIVTIYDVGSEGDLQYIAMEYLEGQTLEQMIKKQVQFSYKIVATIMSQICQALEYAHEQGIVHRDIKPANIMVLPDYTAKVMDFGIARVDSSSMTKTGIAMGTPNYIAPELLQGKDVDRRCDIFSIGVVLYEMLTGRRPFRGESLTALIYSIINDNPPVPSSFNDNMPLLFDHIVDKALKKNPSDRFQKASDMRAALDDFVESFGSARKVGL